MGPDVEEVVRGVEAAFGVEFGCAEIANESTLDDLYNALIRLGGTSDRCLTNIVFWRLRRALMRVLGLPKNVIKPRTTMAALIPPSQRRKTWSALSQTLGLRLPGLDYPSWCALTVLVISLGQFVLVTLWCRWWWAAVSILAVPVVATVLLRVAKPFATAIPPHCETMGDVARTVLGLNHAKLVREFGPSNPSELRKALHYVVVDITGAESHWLQGDTKLIELVETTLLRLQT